MGPLSRAEAAQAIFEAETANKFLGGTRPSIELDSVGGYKRRQSKHAGYYQVQSIQIIVLRALPRTKKRTDDGDCFMRSLRKSAGWPQGGGQKSCQRPFCERERGGARASAYSSPHQCCDGIEAGSD